MKTEDWLVLGGLGALAYFLYKQIGAPLTAAIGSAEDSIAEGIVNLTSPSAAQVTAGYVTMPDGSQFPSSNLTNMQLGYQGSALTFLYTDGNTYQLASANGGYTASPY